MNFRKGGICDQQGFVVDPYHNPRIWLLAKCLPLAGIGEKCTNLAANSTNDYSAIVADDSSLQADSQPAD